MIYAIRAVGTEFIKFGVAASARKRLEMLQTGCPHELQLLASRAGDRETENYIHVRLLKANCHHRGEWFRSCLETKAIIKEMKERALKPNVAGVLELRIANRKLKIAESTEGRESFGWMEWKKYKNPASPFPRVRARPSWEWTPAEWDAWFNRPRNQGRIAAAHENEQSMGYDVVQRGN